MSFVPSLCYSGCVRGPYQRFTGDHGNVVYVSSTAEWDEVIARTKGTKTVIVVDFFASWCPPCRMIGPTFVEYSKQFPSVLFVKIDVDVAREVVLECGVASMPTFQVYKNCEKVDELVGANPNMLLKLVKKHDVQN
eukprot:TRINITY_DN79484_c0_g1_i1.p1 TRINITY_DN79484_c0_g1~~TRINITY_DN79484_c0_g1_i1.p1  ORF type:complete len:136 (+),score=18.50 TRINITY_DN79484_c0_g1_i1:222-629(+)